MRLLHKVLGCLALGVAVSILSSATPVQKGVSGLALEAAVDNLNSSTPGALQATGLGAADGILNTTIPDALVQAPGGRYHKRQNTTEWEPDTSRFMSHSLFCDKLTVARLDPIIAPGGVAPHVHLIFGSSAFYPAMDRPDDGKCTSCDVKLDRSSYWVPPLYVKRNDGYHLMNTSSRKVYYQ
jgi:hypothetical protein